MCTSVVLAIHDVGQCHLKQICHMIIIYGHYCNASVRIIMVASYTHCHILLAKFGLLTMCVLWVIHPPDNYTVWLGGNFQWNLTLKFQCKINLKSE